MFAGIFLGNLINVVTKRNKDYCSDNQVPIIEFIHGNKKKIFLIFHPFQHHCIKQKRKEDIVVINSIRWSMIFLFRSYILRRNQELN